MRSDQEDTLKGFRLSYTEDTAYASKNLIALIAREEDELEATKAELASELAKYAFNEWDFRTSDINQDFSDAHVIAAFNKMASAKQEADKLEVQKVRLEASIGARQTAIQALCGALLQIAKQGISLVHGSLDTAPDGRHVDGIPLKEVVWQGRNQAIHYEDSNFRAPVTAMFVALEGVHGAEFSLSAHQGQSRAKQIVNLLGWRDYSVYENDLKSLGL